MPTNEMILTQMNIEQVSKFIRATSYTIDENVVEFYNVPMHLFDHNATRCKVTDITNGTFDSVLIRIGTFVFIK